MRRPLEPLPQPVRRAPVPRPAGRSRRVDAMAAEPPPGGRHVRGLPDRGRARRGRHGLVYRAAGPGRDQVALKVVKAEMAARRGVPQALRARGPIGLHRQAPARGAGARHRASRTACRSWRSSSSAAARSTSASSATARSTWRRPSRVCTGGHRTRRAARGRAGPSRRKAGEHPARRAGHGLHHGLRAVPRTARPAC